MGSKAAVLLGSALNPNDYIIALIAASIWLAAFS
jgi:hypothetical protein